MSLVVVIGWLGITGTVECMGVESVNTFTKTFDILIGVVGLVVMLCILFWSVRTESVATPTVQLVTCKGWVVDVFEVE